MAGLFQFLKGKCEHMKNHLSCSPAYDEFQFLIGKCEPSCGINLHWCVVSIPYR